MRGARSRSKIETLEVPPSSDPFLDFILLTTSLIDQIPVFRIVGVLGWSLWHGRFISSVGLIELFCNCSKVLPYDAIMALQLQRLCYTKSFSIELVNPLMNKRNGVGQRGEGQRRRIRKWGWKKPVTG